MSGYRVYSIGMDPTISFAGDELARYLTKLLHEPVLHLRKDIKRLPPLLPPGVWIGNPDDVGAPGSPLYPHSPEGDSIDIDISPELDGFSGYITGNSTRAILIGTYRYLAALGCRWTRPGMEGEYIPYEAPFGLDASIQETGGLPVRGVSLLGSAHGACGFNHLLLLVDWLPKIGCNSLLLDRESLASLLQGWGFGPVTPAYIDGAHVILSAEAAKRSLIADASVDAYELIHLGSEDPVGIRAARDVHSRVRRVWESGTGKGLLAHRAVRCSFPLGLPLFALAWAAWNPNLDMEALMDDYLESAFGPGAIRLAAYLESLGESFGVLWKIPPCTGDDAERALKGVKTKLEAFKPQLRANLVQLDQCRRIAWSLLGQHGSVLAGTAEALAAARRGDAEGAMAHRQVLKEALWSRENTLSPVFDATSFLSALDQRLFL